jgi:hypothetical protein
MAKIVGTIKVKMNNKDTDDAYRIGKFWGVNHSEPNSPYYTVTHLATGLALIYYVGYRRAMRLCGVLDVVIPADTEKQVIAIWESLPKEVQQAFRAW